MAERLFPLHDSPHQNKNGHLAARPVRLVEPSSNALGACRLILPEVVYAVAGQEANIYFENLVLSPRPGRYLFDVTCEKGMQHESRWCWIPEDEPGDYPLQIEVRDLDDNVLAMGQTIVRVLQKHGGAIKPFKLLCIGDSLTAASLYPAELLRLFDNGGAQTVTLMGTQTKQGFPAEVRHEGYSGWRYEFFTQKWEADAAPDAAPNLCSSPFLFQGEGGPELDFARYLDEKQAGVRPDYITLFLGINDLFLATEANRQQAIDIMMENAERLIASIRLAAPAAAVGIITPTPPSVSQDSFGETNGNMQTRWTYLKNLSHGLERIMKDFGGREAENIYIVPAYVNLDCEHNYPVVERQANARNEKKIWLNNNEVHPAESGYFQVADSIYGWLKWHLEKNND